VNLLEPVNAASPVWRVGSAVIVVCLPSPGPPDQSTFVVKRSLRNEDVPGSLRVRRMRAMTAKAECVPTVLGTARILDLLVPGQRADPEVLLPIRATSCRLTCRGGPRFRAGGTP